MAEFIVIILTFAAGFLAIFSVNLILTDIFQEERKELRRQLDEQSVLFSREEARNSVLSHQKSDQRASLSELAGEAFREQQKVSIADQLRQMVELSGLGLSPGRLAAISAASAAASAFVMYLATANVAFAVLVAAVAAMLPFTYVQRLCRRRADALRSQLPNAFDLMGRVLRAGQTITQAMYSVSQELRAPVATEFGYCYEQQNLGLSPDIALKDLARRTGLLEIKIFVLALMVHRQTGGNMAELFDKLAEVIRGRLKMRGKIQSLTAEGRMQAIILLGLPVFTFLLMYFFNRPYAVKLFDHSNLIMGTLCSMTVGAVWIRRIVNFDF